MGSGEDRGIIEEPGPTAALAPLSAATAATAAAEGPSGGVLCVRVLDELRVPGKRGRLKMC